MVGGQCEVERVRPGEGFAQRTGAGMRDPRELPNLGCARGGRLRCEGAGLSGAMPTDLVTVGVSALRSISAPESPMMHGSSGAG